MALIPEGGNWRDLPAGLVDEAMGGAAQSGGGKTGYFRRLHSGRPSPTIMGSPTQKSTLLWHPTENRPISAEEAAVLQSYPTRIENRVVDPVAAVPGDISWVYRRPSPTVVGSFRPDVVAAPGYRKPGDPPRQKTPGSVLIDEEQAATLQSYPTHLEEASVTNDLIALDLFAGTGWGVACRWLGIEEYGVDNMPEVIETREANGMKNLFNDVWDGLIGPMESNGERTSTAYLPSGQISVLRNYNLLIASPPCQTFSMAGKGEGRKALDQVLSAIDAGTYKNPEVLKELEEQTDPRTALVLTPLAYAYRDRPKFIVLEQVPTVLPVWERIAEELREIGYSVVTGNLQAEMYGVPQTRKRAILIARNDGVEAKMPTPTHSRYYPRDPKRLDEGVLPWVSMAEALHWGSKELDQHPTLRSNYGTGGDPAARGERGADQPAPTITSKADRNQWRAVSSQSVAGGPRAERPLEEPAFTVTQNSDRVRIASEDESVNLSRDEAAALQSYPTEAWGFTDRPAPTQTGHGIATRQASGQQNIYRDAIEEGNFKFRPPFDEESARISDDPISLSRAYHGEAVNMTATEQATIQAFPPMEWRGKKGKQFLMIGNAVPPLLGKAILETLL